MQCRLSHVCGVSSEKTSYVLALSGCQKSDVGFWSILPLPIAACCMEQYAAHYMERYSACYVEQFFMQLNLAFSYTFTFKHKTSARDT